jgi:hypothetical protein
MVDYEVPFSNGWSLVLHADYAKVDDQWLDAGNTVQLPGYDKVGARATVRSADRKWRIALFGTNLANAEILRNQDGGNYYWQPPRQVGLEFGYEM